MRILQVNKFLYRRGGAETHLFNLIDLLRSHGHDVIPWGMRDPRNEQSGYERYFIDPIDFQKRETLPRQIQKVGHLLYSLEAAQKLDALLTEVKPDIAHLHNIYHHISPSIFSVFKKRRVPVVMTVHDYKLVSPNYRLFNRHGICLCGRGHRYYDAIFKRCVDDNLANSIVAALELSFHKLFHLYEMGVSRFIAPSDFMRMLMIEWGEPEEKFTTLHNFLEPGWFEASYERASAPPPLGAYLLYAGRLSPEKGLLTLIAAVRKLPHVNLKIAGEGPLTDSIRDQIKNAPHIELIGHQAPDALRLTLAGARAAVLPSEWFENYPMALIEAMSMGRPVIASAIGGVPEIVRDGVNGWLFQPGDARELKNLLERLWAAENHVWQSASMASYEQVRSENDPETYYAKIMQIYERA